MTWPMWCVLGAPACLGLLVACGLVLAGRSRGVDGRRLAVVFAVASTVTLIGGCLAWWALDQSLTDDSGIFSRLIHSEATWVQWMGFAASCWGVSGLVALVMWRVGRAALERARPVP